MSFITPVKIQYKQNNKQKTTKTATCTQNKWSKKKSALLHMKFLIAVPFYVVKGAMMLFLAIANVFCKAI